MTVHVMKHRAHALDVLTQGIKNFCAVETSSDLCMNQYCPSSKRRLPFDTVFKQEMWKLSPGGIHAISIEKSCTFLRSMNERLWLPAREGCGICTLKGGRTWIRKLYYPTSDDLAEHADYIENELCGGVCLECVNMGRETIHLCLHAVQEDNATIEESE